MAKRKTLQELTLLDRFLFDEAMEIPENLKTMLDVILGRDVALKYLPQAEKEQRNSPVYRFIKLDVLAQDDYGSVYSTEVQRKNTHNIPRRSRYYQSIIDSKLLEPGVVDFNLLNPVFIIFIAPFDLFGEERYRYTFTMRCDENPDIALNDGAVRIFLNTHGRDDKNITPELKELLYFMEHTNETSKDYNSERVRNLRESVRTIQTNEEVGVRFMQAWEEKILDRQEAEEKGLKEGREEGLKEGREKGLKEGREKGLKEGLKEGREEGREDGLKEGREEGKTSAMVQSISALMETLNMTAEQAMDALMISDNDRKTMMTHL